MIHIEVRKKIVEVRKKGMYVKDIAKAYGVSMSAVNSLLRMERETGDITPKTYLRGRKSTVSNEQLQQIHELIIVRPDITLEEIKDILSLPIKKSAISKIIHNKLGFRYKKRLYMPVSGTEPML